MKTGDSDDKGIAGGQKIPQQGNIWLRKLEEINRHPPIASKKIVVGKFKGDAACHRMGKLGKEAVQQLIQLPQPGEPLVYMPTQTT